MRPNVSDASTHCPGIDVAYEDNRCPDFDADAEDIPSVSDTEPFDPCEYAECICDDDVVWTEPDDDGFDDADAVAPRMSVAEPCDPYEYAERICDDDVVWAEPDYQDLDAACQRRHDLAMHQIFALLEK